MNEIDDCFHRGGGNVENANLNSYGPALQWMMHEAVLAGLLVIPPKRKLKKRKKL